MHIFDSVQQKAAEKEKKGGREKRKNKENINRGSDKAIILSDSCSAITPFETIRAPNILALASSSFDEKSKSHGYDIELNQPKSDDFTFYFDEMLKNERSPQDITFKQLLSYMDFTKLSVHAKMVTTSGMRGNL